MSANEITFNVQLRLYMAEHGLNEANVAEMSGQSVSIVKKWLNGTDHPTVNALRCLVDKGVDVHYLLTNRHGAMNAMENSLLKCFRMCGEDKRQQLQTLASQLQAQVEQEKIDFFDELA